MFENVSQIMEDNDNTFLSEEDIEEEIEIIETEDLIDDQLSDEELSDELIANNDSPVVDESRLVFKGHQKGVLCCALSRDDSLALSGSQDDTACVWSSLNADLLFQCKGHNDSVICADFNSSDTYVATADMSGLIQVWNMSGDAVFDYEVNDIHWMTWHPIAHNVLLAGTQTGEAFMWRISPHKRHDCKTFQSFGSANCVAKCLNDGKQIAMGYEDGVVRVWDLKSTQVLHTIKDFNAHKSTVTSIDCSADNSLIGSGSVDCTAKLINSQTGKVIATFQCGNSNGDEEDFSDSVECVAFSPVQSLFASGTVDGSLEIWDVSTQMRRHVCQQNAGISKLLWDKNNPYLLYTAGLDGVLRIYDGRSGQLLKTKNGHNDHILDFRLSSNSSFVLTASEDSTARIFSLS